MKPKWFYSRRGYFHNRSVAVEGDFLGGDEEAAWYWACGGGQATMRSS